MSQCNEYPYLIVAPDYRESSAGVQVIHQLCHLINEEGGQAWIVNGKVNPDWNTPVITRDIYAAYMQSKLPWIAVYPEVVKGNPLEAPITVRYMLNREAVIMGNKIEHGSKDIFYWYREEFADKEVGANFLTLDCYDLNLFCDDNPHKDLDLLYINRVPESMIEYDKMPAGVTVLSMREPRSLTELAAILKRGRVLYSYESSGTCMLANLCGCPVVALTAKGFEKYALNEDTFRDNGNAGFTLINTPKAIEETYNNLHKVRETLLSKREKAFEQLQQFLVQTQHSARQKAQSLEKETLTHFLTHRRLTARQQKFINSEPAASLLLVIFTTGNENELANTLNSFEKQLKKRGQCKVLLVGGNPVKNYLHTQPEKLNETILALASNSIIEWIQAVYAGTIYTAESIALITYSLAQASTCHAIYADEAEIQDDGNIIPFFKSDFNLDLLLSAPFLYAKRFFIRFSTWLELGGWDLQISKAFEFDLLVRLIGRYDISAIGHYTETINSVPTALCNEACPSEELAVINHYLIMRQFTDATAEMVNNERYRISYFPSWIPRVSIIITGSLNINALHQCVTSLINNTEWPDFEIVVPLSQTNESKFKQYVNDLEKAMPKKIKLALVEDRVTGVQIINHCVRLSTDDLLLLLDVNMVCVMRNWLISLVHHSGRPEIAFVAPKIISLNKKIIGGGAIFGMGNGIEHIGRGYQWDCSGPRSYLTGDQNFTALTTACLLIRREIWNSLDGLPLHYTSPEIALLALCIAVREKGMLSLWSPYSVIAATEELLANEWATDRDHAQRTQLIIEKASWFTHDPAYNRHYSLTMPFTIDCQYIQDWRPLSKIDSPRIVLAGNARDTEYAHRFDMLRNALSDMEQVHFFSVGQNISLPELLRLAPEALVLQGEIDNALVDVVSAAKLKLNVTVSYLLDDGVNAPEHLRDIVDRWLCYSAEQVKWLCTKALLPSRMPEIITADWFTSKPPQHNNTKCRILCPTAQMTSQEWEFLGSLLAETHETIDWIICGKCPSQWLPFISEKISYPHDRLSADRAKTLNIDLVLAFRDNRQAHRYRDGYQLRQFIGLGIAVMCSDVPSFADVSHVKKICTNKNLWLEALNDYAATRRLLGINTEAAMAQAANAFMLNDVLANRVVALMTSKPL